MKLKALCLAALAATAIAAPAMAHHSFAMFANDKTVVLKGTVEEFEWTNPHAWLHITAMNDAGKAEEWAFEMGSPLQLVSHGWSKDSVKVGDQVSIQMHPMKDGSHGGSFMTATLANGVVVGGRAGGPPPAVAPARPAG